MSTRKNNNSQVRKSRVEEIRRKISEVSVSKKDPNEELVGQFENMVIKEGFETDQNMAKVIKEQIKKRGIESIETGPSKNIDTQRLCGDNDICFVEHFVTPNVEQVVYVEDVKDTDFEIHMSEFVDFLVSTRDYSAVLLSIFINPVDLQCCIPFSMLWHQYKKLLIFLSRAVGVKQHLALVKEWIKKAAEDMSSKDPEVVRKTMSQFNHFTKHAVFTKEKEETLTSNSSKIAKPLTKSNFEHFQKTLIMYPVDKMVELGIEPEKIQFTIGYLDYARSIQEIKLGNELKYYAGEFLEGKINHEQYYRICVKNGLAHLKLFEKFIALVSDFSIIDPNRRTSNRNYSTSEGELTKISSGLTGIVNSYNSVEYDKDPPLEIMDCLNLMRAKYILVNTHNDKEVRLSTNLIEKMASTFSYDTTLPSEEYLKSHAKIQTMDGLHREEIVRKCLDDIFSELEENTENVLRNIRENDMIESARRVFGQKQVADIMSREAPPLDPMEEE